MSGFLFAFLASLLATFGARDQATVAQLGAAQGRRPLLLATALASTIGTTVFVTWAAVQLKAGMTPEARGVFAAMALVFSGAEMLVLGQRKAPAEPTHSLFAAAIVLGAHQVTDATRFLVLALAVGTAAPITAGAGGAIGACLAIGAGWAMPELATAPQLRLARRVAGAVLLVIGMIIGWGIIID